MQTIRAIVPNFQLMEIKQREAEVSRTEAFEYVKQDHQKNLQCYAWWVVGILVFG